MVQAAPCEATFLERCSNTHSSPCMRACKNTNSHSPVPGINLTQPCPQQVCSDSTDALGYLGQGSLQIQRLQPLSCQVWALKDFCVFQSFCHAKAVSRLIVVVVVVAITIIITTKIIIIKTTPPHGKTAQNSNTHRWQRGQASLRASPCLTGEGKM